MRLSLVIPCFNEALNLPLLIERCARVTETPDVEVVLVDNGSVDDTPRVLSELLAGRTRIRSVRVPQNRGYGYGIVSGLREASGTILAWTHADMQTDPMDAIRGLDRFGDGEGRELFVKGRRHGRPAADVAFTVGMSLFESALLRRAFWDINAQPTMFHRDFFARWQAPPDDFSLDLYAYYQARALGYRVERFPVHFGQRAHGVSHWNVDFASKAKFIRRTMSFSFRLRKELVNQ